MFSLILHSSESPAAVLATLRARGGEWRESQSPEALRRAGAVVTCVAAGDTVTLAFRYWRPRHRGPVDPYLVVRAAVSPAPSGGTAVRVWGDYVVLRDVIQFSAWSVGLVIVLGVVTFGAGVLLLLAVPALSAGVQARVLASARRDLTRAGSPEADYLVRRVEQAVAATAPESTGSAAR